MTDAADRPAPLVPNEIDLRGLAWMPLDTIRLLDSDLYAHAPGDGFKAAVALWCKAWQQVPAGSLPGDERRLATMIGVAPARWRAIRDWALRGFVLCSDGRFYHSVIAAKAMETWEFREKQRSRAKGRWADPADSGTAAARTGASTNKTGQDRTRTDLVGDPPSPFVAPGWLPMEPWDAYVEWRQRVRKPLTAYAKKLAVKDLERLRADGHEPAAVLDQSLLRGWLGLFPVRDAAAGAPQSRQSALEASNLAAAKSFAGKKP